MNFRPGKRAIIILLILVVLSAIISFVNSIFRQPTPIIDESTPNPTPPATYNIPLGEVNQQDLTQPGSFQQTKTTGDLKSHEYTSTNPLLQDKIITRNNQVVMKITTLVTANGTYPPIAGYFTNFGEPEKVYFDTQYETQVYAWPTKGFAVAGSRELNQAFRTYEFEATTSSQFEATYSEFIEPQTAHTETLGY